MTEVHESFAEVLNAADKCQKIIQDIKNCEKDSLNESAGKVIVLDFFSVIKDSVMHCSNGQIVVFQSNIQTQEFLN